MDLIAYEVTLDLRFPLLLNLSSVLFLKQLYHCLVLSDPAILHQ